MNFSSIGSWNQYAISWVFFLTIFSPGLGQRPVARRVSATHNDLISKFEQQNRRPSTSSLFGSGTGSSSTVSGLSSPARSGTSTPSVSAAALTTPERSNLLNSSLLNEKLNSSSNLVAAGDKPSTKVRTGTTKTKVTRTKAEVCITSDS